MDIRWVMVAFALWDRVYDKVIVTLADRQRKRPVPAEVADVYDEGTYEDYLDHTQESNRLSLLHQVVLLLVEVPLLFSPLFTFLDATVGDNPYLVTILTGVALSLATLPIDVLFSFRRTFVVDARYGLNRQTRASFARDVLIDEVTSLVTSLALMALVTFAATHMEAWTNGFTVSVTQAALLAAGLVGAFFAFAFVASLASLVALKMQYKLTPLPAGPLRDELTRMLATCRKRVRSIQVYDESSKSTKKNAFVLSIPLFRMIGISDTFLDGNSERELLAVLSHEIGHLRHRRDLLDLTVLALPVALLVTLAALLLHPEPVFALQGMVRSSFGIAHDNYYELVSVLILFAEPPLFLFDLLKNYRSRRNEYEADQQAVACGYGAELEATLKRTAAENLTNVNPHPVIECIEYDHPGLARRVRALRAGQANGA